MSVKKDLGNTPTRVGKTKCFQLKPDVRWKHPHACGEDRVGGRKACRLPRNTPTRVGKTINTAAYQELTRKHPHACGEDDSINNAREASVETPPRVWGRLSPIGSWQASCGNTPTRVGKTCSFFHSPFRDWKHPHACGEDLSICPK